MPEVVVGNEQEPLTLKFQDTEAIRSEILAATRKPDSKDDVLHPLVHRLRNWRGDQLTTLIVCSTRGQAERVKAMLEPKSLKLGMLKERFELSTLLTTENTPAKGRLRDRSVHAQVVLGEISHGFIVRTANLAVIAEEDIFGQRVKASRRRSPTTGEHLSDLKDRGAGE
ncbi:unnamed protein product, partial [Laminaria digitata]